MPLTVSVRSEIEQFLAQKFYLQHKCILQTAATITIDGEGLLKAVYMLLSRQIEQHKF